MTTPSKIERWQRAAKINGRPISSKGMAPVLGYKVSQWGVGPSGAGERKKRGLTRRGRFNPNTGPGRT